MLSSRERLAVADEPFKRNLTLHPLEPSTELKVQSSLAFIIANRATFGVVVEVKSTSVYVPAVNVARFTEFTGVVRNTILSRPAPLTESAPEICKSPAICTFLCVVVATPIPNAPTIICEVEASAETCKEVVVAFVVVDFAKSCIPVQLYVAAWSIAEISQVGANTPPLDCKNWPEEPQPTTVLTIPVPFPKRS